jgi:hypothetical protein
MKKFLAIALLIAALAPTIAAQKAAGAFTGKWEGTFTLTRPDGTEAPPRAVVFDLTQKGNVLTGTAGPPDRQTNISKGAVTAGKATFEVAPPEGQQLFKFALTVVKGRLQGDMTGERDGVVSGKAKVDAGKAAAAKAK